MDPKTFRRSSFLILFFSLLFCKCAVGAGPAEIWVTNPWLTMVARFIGGAQVNVRPLVVWNDSGITEKTRKEPPGGTLVIAVDNEEIIRFLGKAGLYMEDLFVKPQYRGYGYGKAILKRLAQIAVERGCGRLEWWCLDWNKPSIDFYRSLGAEPMDDWTVYRISGETLQRLANG